MASTHTDSTSHHNPEVYHQFETLEQQNDSYIVGMWTFLVTEVMFFGGMFFIYILYRWSNQDMFYTLHKELNITWGAVNTIILLLSSFSMACAVHHATLKNRKQQQMFMGITALLASAFLVVKLALEWYPKWQHGHMPWFWNWPGHVSSPDLLQVPGGTAKMFYSLYFAMTGLHGIHVLIGIICILILMYLTKIKSILVDSFLPTEMFGLYWHFVDLVWIFLFPLFYLMPK